jgi:fructose/tagatose bisphosphate aldolase
MDRREPAAFARMAHAFGAAVEGELGAFGGYQGSQEFTDPRDVLDANEGHIGQLKQAALRVRGEAQRRLRLMGANGRAT